MAIERGIVSEYGKFVVIASLYNVKGEGTECRSYRGISL